ncbi:Flp pilus assembly protein TadG [Solimonas aquatica]|uniref:Flp pilus assembly protein TadG n=1 Tax=Solimonas aquatica TaxID=489703 RepID=A0A1H9JNZ6_9GAMM|nr:TadE/TadG family type IV pilus assembly protein [Solimonas aquatica]SEQ88508.1 Flp pilus assembly protein TadG [Solimonas aquatica]
MSCLAATARPEQAGAAALEFALVLPIFVAMLYGLINLGLVYYTQLAVSRAAEDGARAVDFLSNSSDYTSVKNEVLNSLANSIVAPAASNGSYATRRSWLASNVLPQISVDSSLSCAGVAASGSLRVRVVYPYSTSAGTRLLPTITLPGVGSDIGVPSTLIGCAVVKQ